MLHERSFPYNTLPFFKYVTNTEFIEEQLAAKTPDEAKSVDTFLNLMRPSIQEAVEFELDGYQ